VIHSSSALYLRFHYLQCAVVPLLLLLTLLLLSLLLRYYTQLISANGRTDVMKDAQNGTPGASFPYTPKLLADLSKSQYTHAHTQVTVL
jgi:hypothetical protein